MEAYKNLSDEQMILRLKAGDQSCMDLLIEKYRNMVKYQSRALYLMGGDQEDLIQEGMIGLFKAIRDYDPEKRVSEQEGLDEANVSVQNRESGFAAFARLCVTRQLYSAIQASNRQKHAPLNSYVELSEELQEEGGNVPEQNPETLLIAQEDLLSLQERLRSQLSAYERKVLDLYLLGKNYQEIAELLGKPPKSIDNALQRIRKKVEKIVDKA